MVRVTQSFVRETLWPEFRDLNETLHGYLDEVTQRVIAQGIFGDTSDAETRPEQAGAGADESRSAQHVLDLE